jgi:hypothetical protein
VVRSFLVSGLVTAGSASLAQPALDIESAGPQTVRLSWPVGPEEFALEQTDSLSGDPVWTVGALVPERLGDQFVVVIQATDTSRYFRLRAKPAAPVFTITAHTPLDGAKEVGSTYRPQVFFSRPVDPASLTAQSFFATAGSTRLAANIVPANDGSFAWLFFQEPMPGATRIRVTLDGASIRSASGALLDADGDGQPGGVRVVEFTTVSLVPVLGTSLAGLVVDPGPDLLPHTADDFNVGPDGQRGTADDVYLLPLAGVEVFLLGLEGTKVKTGADGRFRLEPVPVGNVKVAVNGMTVPGPPAGVYFPEMVMDAQMKAGRQNTVMLGMAEIYLPRLRQSILETVSANAGASITVSEAGALELTPAQRANLHLEILPGTLVGKGGQPLAQGQVGLSTVPPELVRDMLPPGVLQHAFDITIQAPGIETFSTPAPITFPNVYNAPPGTKLNLLSFDHTTGRLVIEGGMTVSTDGKTITSDPGTGIVHPGWHAPTPPGVRSDSPCDPDAAHDVVVNPIPRVLGVQNYFFVSDDGGFTLSFANLAGPLKPDKDPCDPANLRATALVIEVQADFKSFDTFLNGLWSFEKIWLQPGQFTTRPVALRKLLTPGNITSAKSNRLFGARVRLKGYRSDRPDRLLLSEEFFVYRFFDIGDHNHTDGIIDFEKTLADGAEKAFQTKPWEEVMPYGDVAKPRYRFTSLGASDGLHFLFRDGEPRFDPVAGDGELTDTLEVLTPNGSVAGTLQLRGTARPKHRVLFAREDLREALRAFLDEIPVNFAHVPVRSLFFPDADEDGFLSDEPGFDAAVGTLYEATVANLRGIFSAVDPLAGGALELVDGRAGDGIVAFPTVADVRGPFTTLPMAAYNADADGDPAILGDSNYAKYEVSIGAIDPDTEVTLIFQHSADGGFWGGLGAVGITPPKANSSDSYQFELVGRFHRARLVHRTGGSATVTVTVQGGQNPCFSAGGCAVWADFDKDEFARYDNADPPMITGGLVAQDATYSSLQERWLFDALLNRSLNDPPGPDDPGAVILNFDQISLALAGTLPDTALFRMVNTLASSFAHEVGHVLGAIHLRDRSNAYIAGDVMGNEARLTDRAGRFKFFAPLVRKALGLPITVEESHGLWDYYKRWEGLEKFSHNVALPGPHDDDSDLEVPFPVLTVFDAPLVVGEVGARVLAEARLPRTPADGAGAATSGLTVFLVNDGGKDLTLESIRFVGGDRGFSVEPVNLPLRIPHYDLTNPLRDPNVGMRPLIIRFDPVTPGEWDDQLEIVSDSFRGETTIIPFSGRGASLVPDISLEVINNNAGGVLLNQGALEIPAFARLSNRGLQDLRLTRVELAPGRGDPEQFRVLAPLAGLSPEMPLVLAPDQRVELGFAFDPSTRGLQTAKLLLHSNDPDTPVLTHAVLGTGLSDDGAAPFAYGSDFVAFALPNNVDTPVLRTVSDDAGNFSFFLPAQADYETTIFDPVDGTIARLTGNTGPSGGRVALLTPAFVAAFEPDLDGDGLPGELELSIGTAADNPDTDGDGLNDGEEIRLASDPLDGIVATIGIVAGVRLRGEAKAVCVEGQLGNPRAQWAYVATAAFGLAIVDVSNPRAPVVRAELDLPGECRAVAFDPARALAILAAGEAGVHLVDVRDPAQPTLVGSVPTTFPARRVVAGRGVAFVAHRNVVTSIDLDSATAVQSLDVGRTFLTIDPDIALGGAGFFTLRHPSVLVSFATDGPFMRELAAIDLRKDKTGLNAASLSVVDGLLLNSNPGTGLIGGGFTTVDVSDPAAPVVISNADDTGFLDFPTRDLANNGAGRAVLVGDTRLNVMDISDPGRTAQLLFGVTMPPSAESLVLASGLAYVANGPAGLTIVNYNAPDVAGVSPVVALDVSVNDVDPVAPGVQIIEGTAISVAASVQDDFGVRQVELLVNGVAAFVDSSVPFDLVAVAPAFERGKSVLELRVRAMDTGANSALSEPVLVEIVEDGFPPRIMRTVPSDGGVLRAGAPETVEVYFNESLDPATVNSAALRLRSSTGATIDPATIRLDAGGKRIVAGFDALPPDNYTLELDTARLTDRAGNPVGNGPFTSAFSAVAFTVEWINPAGGDWNNPQNWSGGRVPGPADKVFIATAPGATVRVVPNQTVEDLFVVGGNLGFGLNVTLTINGRAQIENLLLTGMIAGNGSLALTGYSVANGNLGPLSGGVVNRGTVEISFLSLNQTTLRNRGLILQRSGKGASGSPVSARVDLNGSGVLHNEVGGVIELGASTVTVRNANNLIKNEGVLRKLTDRYSSSGTTIAARVENTGQLEVVGGELRFNGGLDSALNGAIDVGDRLMFAGISSLYTLNGNHRFTGDGAFQLNGSTARLIVPAGSTLTAAMGGSSFEIVAGTLEVAGTFENARHARWSGGTISVTGEARNLGTLEIVGSASLAGTLVNRGLIRHTDVSVRTLTLRNGTLLNDVAATYELGRGSFSVGTGTTDNNFENRGLLRKLPSTGTSSFTVPVRNSGVLDAGDGTLILSGGLVQTSGELRLNGGSLTGSRTIDLQGGMFGGAGAIQATVINAATIMPGGPNAAGTLAITGAYTQAAGGTLNLELGGTVSGQFDLVTVSGRATLDGTLNVSTLAGFALESGQSFKVLTYGSRVGDFAIKNGLTQNGITLMPQLNARDLTLLAP